MDAILSTDELRPRAIADEVRLRDAGFRWGQKGTHTSRTIMLDELQAVLANCRPDAARDDYLLAIHDDNCLGKRTVATRKLSSQRLSELYALDPEVPLFDVDVDRSGHGLGLPVLLALCGSLMERSTKGGLIVVGALNLGGSVEMIHNPVAVAELAVEKSAAQLLMPISARRQLLDLPDEMATKVNIVFYADPADAFMKAILE